VAVEAETWSYLQYQ